MIALVQDFFNVKDDKSTHGIFNQGRTASDIVKSNILDPGASLLGNIEVKNIKPCLETAI